MPPKPLNRTGTSSSKDSKPDKTGKSAVVAQSTAADVKVNLALNALKDAPPVVALLPPALSSRTQNAIFCSFKNVVLLLTAQRFDFQPHTPPDPLFNS